MDFQDRQRLDSLYVWFHHKDPTYRYAATMAFASIKKAEALDSLYPMLKDPIDEVKMAAAYAIGQIGEAADEQKLIEAFDNADTLGHSKANAAILEAVGKCGGPEVLKFLSTISTYQPTDTLLLEGQSWGLYRFALRKMTLPEGTRRMVGYATNPKYPSSVRLIAANYLQRGQNLTFPETADSLINTALKREENPDIRMALAIGLGKTKTGLALEGLMNQLSIETDYRVKCNILRALSNFKEDERVEPIVFDALKDQSLPVALTAANYLLAYGDPKNATKYWRAAKENTLHWQVQTTLYAAANRHIPYYFADTKKAINWELRQRFEKSTNPYEKAEALKALGEHGWNYRYIKNSSYVSDFPIVRTSGVEALAHICDKAPDDFRRFFGAGYRRVRKDLGNYFLEAIANGDPGMTYVAAQALRDPKNFFKGTIDSLSIMEKALKKLRLPQEIESYNELNKTLHYFKDEKEPAPVVPEFNHPIDFRILNTVNSDTKVKLHTTRGTIQLELLPNIAPGTVANFIQLIKIDFYKGKNFHRVVPNFVAQGGCPRGDGFGSLDYTIRSELPLMHYDAEGYVGMASAGNHTESTQFFITHSPTPHLDGNYTIFARVTDGMEVVHQLEMGDVIERVEIKN